VAEVKPKACCRKADCGRRRAKKERGRKRGVSVDRMEREESKKGR